MIPKINVDKFLNSSVLSTSIFIAGGTYKTYKDYKNANEKYKDKFLIKDCVILSGAALGMLSNYTLGHKITSQKSYKKLVETLSKKLDQSKMNKNIKTSINYTTAIVKEILTGFLTAASGIIGALGMDYLLSKTNFKQPEITQNTYHKNNTKLEDKLEKLSEDDRIDAFYNSMTEVPQLRFLATGMVGIDAIEIAQNKKFEDKLEHTTGYLVNDTLVPLLFLSSANAFTQNIKPKFRVPIVVSTLFAGTLFSHKLFDKYAESKAKPSS